MPTPQKRPSTRHYLQTTSDNRRSAWCMHDADGRPRPFHIWSFGAESGARWAVSSGPSPTGWCPVAGPMCWLQPGLLGGSCQPGSADPPAGYRFHAPHVDANNPVQRETIWNWAELGSDRCWREAACVICRHWAAVHRGRSASSLPLSAARRRHTGLRTDQHKAASATSVRCRHC